MNNTIYWKCSFKTSHLLKFNLDHKNYNEPVSGAEKQEFLAIKPKCPWINSSRQAWNMMELKFSYRTTNAEQIKTNSTKNLMEEVELRHD